MKPTGNSGAEYQIQHIRSLSSAKSSILTKCLKSAAWYFVIFLFLCLVVEGLLRGVYHPENIGTVIQFDPHIGWRLKSDAHMRSVDTRRGLDYQIRVNSLGMREREFLPVKKSGTRRILVIGDSIVFGTGVDVDWRFSNFMDRAMGDTVEVLNGGVPGWGSDQELIYYESIAGDFDPDIVILSVTIANDVLNNMLDHLFLQSAPKPRFILHGDSLRLTEPVLAAPSRSILHRIRNFLKHHSRLLVFVKRRVEMLRYRFAEKDDPSCVPTGFEKKGLDKAYSHWSVYEKSYSANFEKAWATTEAILDRFVTSCRQNGSEFIIFAFPLKIEVDEEWRHKLMQKYDIESARFDFEKPYRRLSAFCMRHDIQFIYPLHSFIDASKRRRLYFQNDSHPNQYGNAAAARILLNVLRDRYELPSTIAENDLAYFLTDH